jgi:hypothetical protein
MIRPVQFCYIMSASSHQRESDCFVGVSKFLTWLLNSNVPINFAKTIHIPLEGTQDHGDMYFVWILCMFTHS